MVLKNSNLLVNDCQAAPAHSGSVKRILILASNPKDTDHLRLNEEVREIKEGLQRSKYRDQFEIYSEWAVRFKDLRRALLDIEPNIVHFTGTGDESGLLLEDKNGYATRITPGALSELFYLFSNKIECVILSACYSKRQAKAINTYIKYVIGMRKEIKDQIAIEFAVGFYDALGAGKTVDDAFKFGQNAIIGSKIPILMKNPGIRIHAPIASQSMPGRKKEQEVKITYDPNDESWLQLRQAMIQMKKTSVYGECSLEILFVEPSLTALLPNCELRLSELKIGDALELLEDFVFKRNHFSGDDYSNLPAVLFGDYGSGKSSTLRMLASRLGENNTAPFPIFIPLREAILRHTNNLYESIEEFLLLNYEIRDLKKEIHRRPICWLLDGFDELNLIEAEEKNWISQRYKEIERFARITQSIVILSSRPILFLGKPSNIPEKTVRFNISLFDETRIQKWISKWLSLPNHKESSLSIKGLKDRNLFFESCNPLILFMVASLFDEELAKEKPYLRAEIFKTFIDSTESGKFFKEQNHQYAQPLPGNYRKILQEIAFIIFRYGEAGLISKSKLMHYLPKYESMEEILNDQRLGSLLVGHFFREAKQTKIESYIEFSHQSFREYLVVEKFINMLLNTSKETYNIAEWSDICSKMLSSAELVFLMESLCMLSGEERLRIFETYKIFTLDTGGFEKQLADNEGVENSKAILKRIHFTSTIRKIVSYFICSVIACNASDTFRKKLLYGTKSCLITIYHSCHSYPHNSTIKIAWDSLMEQLPGGILGPGFQWYGFEIECKNFNDYAIFGAVTNTIILSCQNMFCVFIDLKKAQSLHLGATNFSYCIFRGGTLLLTELESNFENCVFINCRIVGIQAKTKVSTKKCTFHGTKFVDLQIFNEEKRCDSDCEEFARRAIQILTDYADKIECSNFVPWGEVIFEKLPGFEKVMFNIQKHSSVLSHSNLCRLIAIELE